MINLQLEPDEGIKLQAEEVEWYGEKERSLNELILTNKNIFYSYQFKASLFSKSETKIVKIPLTNIKVVDGKAQVTRLKDSNYGDVLQVLYVDGTRELFSFCEPKKEIPQWANAINSAVTGSEEPLIEVPQKKKGFFVKKENEGKGVIPKPQTIGGNAASLEALVAGFAGMVESTKSVVDDMSKVITENASQSVLEPQKSNERKENSEVQYCNFCGEKLPITANFCNRCGKPIGNSSMQKTDESQQMEQTRSATMKQEYAGTVTICPQCGGTLDGTMVSCPFCGMKISGIEALSSVQVFTQKLMEIEAGRKKSTFKDVYIQSANPADVQKLSLIRNFPVPNTIEDIQEFMLLAVANIDVKISKNTAAGKMNSIMNSGNINLSMQKDISDAWVAKMQQMYQKAEILFPNEPNFKGLQKVYFEKMKELNMKVN